MRRALNHLTIMFLFLIIFSASIVNAAERFGDHRIYPNSAIGNWNNNLDHFINSSSRQPLQTFPRTLDANDSLWTDRFSTPAGLGGGCNASCEFNGLLIAAGYFEAAGCTLAAKIASWDGSRWSPLGSGITGPYSQVYSLIVYDSMLIAAGLFDSAGSVSANNIAAWNGSTWSPLGSGMNRRIHSLAIYGGDLIAGGEFDTAGGNPAAFIAVWNGSNWASFGTGLNMSVSALTNFDTMLVAGGGFDTAGTSAAYYIAAWDGSDWQPLGNRPG